MGVDFKATFFMGNREKLRNLFAGSAPVVLTAHGQIQRNSDDTFPFRQDSSFWYLTGLELPDVVLVMDKGKEYLILPAVGRGQEVMESKQDTAAMSEVSGISEILDHKTGWKQLNSRLKKVKHIATLSAAPNYIDAYGFYTNPARAALIEKLKQQAPKAELLDLRPHLAKMRMIKQPEEIVALQTAINITMKAFKKVQAKLSRYTNESQIEFELISEYLKSGASGHAFYPVIASGQNGTTPHYRANNTALEPRKLITVDTGAEVSNYAADITRTYAVGSATKRQRDVFNAVLDVQDYGKRELKKGITIREYEQLIEHYMGEKLRELGLIKSINQQNVRRYYPHSCSHYLGLDVHDAGDYDAPLAAGMVVTVEPGIYIEEEGIGVRIEDDVLITDKKNIVLSRKLPAVL